MDGLPLEGVRVLEVTRGVPGAYAGALLADLGATVVKVEEPGSGDPLRQEPPILEGGESVPFITFNRFKRGITLHVAHPKGRRVFTKLLEASDVLLHSLPPTLLRLLGLTQETLKEIRPNLVVCSVTPFGEKGPYVEAAGPDLVLEAMSGFLLTTADRSRQMRGTGTSVAERAAGFHAALGICAALIRCGRNGGGCSIEVTGMDCVVSLLGPALQGALLSEIKRTGKGQQVDPVPVGVYRTGDRPLAIVADTPQAWQQVCSALGLEALLEDERFASAEDRAVHRKELRGLLEKKLKQKTAAEWVEDLRERGVPSGPVNAPRDLPEDPHLLARDSFGSYSHALYEKVPMLKSPIRFRGITRRSGRAAPLLGEHNHQVYRELLGYTEGELKRLRNEKVV
jgi:formyl-CoA transferase